MKAYAETLSFSASNAADQLDIRTLLKLILTLGKENYASNHFYIPVLQSLEQLVEGEIASELSRNVSDLQLWAMFDLTIMNLY